jgi:hypothetical protein
VRRALDQLGALGHATEATNGRTRFGEIRGAAPGRDTIVVV